MRLTWWSKLEDIRNVKETRYTYCNINSTIQIQILQILLKYLDIDSRCKDRIVDTTKKIIVSIFIGRDLWYLISGEKIKRYTEVLLEISLIDNGNISGNYR